MTKITIPNDDPDNPENTREVGPASLDLTADSRATGPDFRAAIARAAVDASNELETRQETDAPEPHQRAAAARDELKRRTKDLTKQLAAEFDLGDTGYGISGEPRVYKKRPKEEYDLWRRIIPMFVERPETLDMRPGELVAKFCTNPGDEAAIRNRLYDKLNLYAQSDLEKLLSKLGVSLALKKPVTIRSIQKQLLARRDDGSPTEEFTGRFVIQGDTAYVNGKPYKIQTGASGKRRIKRGGVWLVLATVKTFCTD